MPPSTHTELTLRDKVRALQAPATYGRNQSVSAIETHFSWIFFTETLAYKLKKPVLIERMDFRTLQVRQQSCQEEVRLNRRLAPEIYLGVVSLIRASDGSMRIGDNARPDEETIEWLVKMRRLPESGLLDTAIRNRTVSVESLLPIAKHLAEFYRSQPTVPFTTAEYLTRLRGQIKVTHQQLLADDLGLDSALVSACTQQQRAALNQCADALSERAAKGRIVEGHGDLRPEHIFLGGSFGNETLAPCVIDSLEFDRDLRIFDPYEELAFLSLECERLDQPWIGREFMTAYRATSGDNIDSNLFDFYRAQRALTRAKIAAWHVRDPEVSGLADWHERAHSYLRNALQPAQGID
jgi:aminoglycoside phosphotransferase family enzyme